MREFRIPNPDVTWEVANQSNVGFDGALAGRQIKFSADYFYNYRTNILWQRNASVPESSGLTLPRENIGEVSNQGFDFLISYSDNIVDLIIRYLLMDGYQKNKIKFWDETPGIPEYQKSTGSPMNAALYYNAIGILKIRQLSMLIHIGKMRDQVTLYLKMLITTMLSMGWIELGPIKLICQPLLEA